MNPRRNAAMATVALLAIGLLALGHLLTWAKLILALVLVIEGIVLMLDQRRRPGPLLQEPEITYVSVSPPERSKERVTDVLLPSRHDDYHFLFSATVLWTPTAAVLDESRINMAALAVDAVLRRARDITRQRDPGSASLIRHELGAALAAMQADATGCLRAMAGSVQLALPDHDQERLDKLAAVRKDEAIWEHARKYEQSRRTYLSGDVLKDPGSAVVWWLTRNDDQVEKTVRDIGLIAQLSAAANNTDVPETFQQFVAGLASHYSPGSASPSINGSDAHNTAGGAESATDHFDAFLQAMGLGDGDPGRLLFARRVADLVTTHGRPEVADAIMARFDEMNTNGFPQEADDGN